MIYNVDQLEELAEKITSKIINELRIANMQGEADTILKKYGFATEVDNSYPYIDIRNSKILVIGTPQIGINHLKLAAKKNRVTEKHIEFVDDYEKLTNFDSSILKNSPVYSDVLVGPMPHKIKGIDGYNSLTAMIRANEEDYPKLTELRVNGELKITKTSFEQGLQNTKYYAEVNC